MDTVEAVRAECEALSGTVLALPEEDFAKPTRLPEWNVKELLAHIYRNIERINVALSQPAPAMANADSVSYWRSYDPATDGVDIADRSKELAATYRSGRDLARGWEEMWPSALAGAAAADHRRLVMTWGPALTLEEFLRTRVLEMAVHGMDLHSSLGLAPAPTREGLGITVGILRALLGKDLPPGLWDDVTFVEKGTGRRPLTDAERGALGELADSFPLLQ